MSLDEVDELVEVVKPVLGGWSVARSPPEEMRSRWQPLLWRWVICCRGMGDWSEMEGRSEGTKCRSRGVGQDGGGSAWCRRKWWLRKTGKRDEVRRKLGHNIVLIRVN